MTRTNISLKKEAYDFLKSLKNGRSFSDVILSFKTQKQNLLRFHGILNDVDWKKREEEMNDFRQSFSRPMR